MNKFCGIDWAEDHHDVAVIDTDGQLVIKRRITDDADGFAELLGMLESVGDTSNDPIPVAIETPRGLLVAALRATGRPVYAINPMAVARYRERHSASRKKSDHADAMTLANILRTDAHMHRQLPGDSDLVRSIAVLARAAQDAAWRRTRATQELRALLREYYPTFLDAFAGTVHTNLAKPEARAVLAIAPTPQQGARLTKPRIIAALRRAGRQRMLDQTATRIQHALRRPQLHQPLIVEQAMGRQAVALLATLDTECANADNLTAASAEAFRQHPDYQIITSFPGLGESTGARVLAEIGDDRRRFADARGLKAFAGSAPITRASGRSTSITHRRVKNNRLAAVGFVWAFAAIPRPGPTKDHYERRRALGDRHAAALRHLFNRFLGQLWHCLQTEQTYNESKAWSSVTTTSEPNAA
ncbi:MAG TPA: IS110 family transposase [Mycobacterium sp.]|nr:IS110 family transposase [Mycobacterium sp.]